MGDCTIASAPCESFGYAEDRADVTPDPDTIHLAAGVYRPDIDVLTVSDVTWSGPHAGTPADRQSGPAAEIRVPANRTGFILQGPDIVIDGLTFQSENEQAADGALGVMTFMPGTVRNSVFRRLRSGVYAINSVTVSGVDLQTTETAMSFAGMSGQATAEVTRTRFAAGSGSPALHTEGFSPLTVTDSDFAAGAFGVSVYAGSGSVSLQRNRFSPELMVGLSNLGSPVDATDNWWGCNGGPNAPGCATSSGPGATTTAPHLQLWAFMLSDPVAVDGAASFVAGLRRSTNSFPVTPAIPRLDVTFAAQRGHFDRAALPLAGGPAVATLIAPASAGGEVLTATLDAQVVTVPVDVVEVDPTITVAGGVTAARSGTVINVSGAGWPGRPLQVQRNGSDVGSPVSVSGEATWTSTVTLGDGDNVLRAVQGSRAGDGPTVVGVYPPPLSSPQADARVLPTATVAGTAIPGAVVDVVDADGTTVGSETVGTCGCFSIESDPLPLGAQTLTVTQTFDGVTSTERTVDVTVVPQPTISVDRSSGMVGDPLRLTGSGLVGATLVVRNNGDPIATVTVDDDGSWTADTTLRAGDNDLDVVQDGSEYADPVTVHGFTEPGIYQPTPLARVRSTFTVSGFGFAGVRLTVTDEHGTEIGRTTVDACGCWTLRTTEPLSDGPHTLTVSQIVDGTPRSTTVPVVVDATALEVVSPTDTDMLPAEGLRVSGLGAPGALVRVYRMPDDQSPIATVTVDGDGRFDVPVELAAGFPSLAVTQTPVDGEESDPVEISLILLLNPPTIGVDGAATVREGEPIAVSGVARPGAHVVLYRNDEAVTDVTADQDGAWSGAVTALAGDNAVAAMQVVVGLDPAFSGVSAAVNAIGVGAPTVASPADGDLIPSRFAISGTALPGATVTVVAGTETVATATADATTGAWSTTATEALAYGDHDLEVHQRLDGVTGAGTTVSATVVPDAPTVLRPDGDELGDGAIVVTGTADPFAAVDVFLNGALLPTATATANADGAFEATVDVAPGSYTVRTAQRVGTSLTSPLSEPRSIVVRPLPPTVRLDSAASVAAGDPISLSGQALPGATVLIEREAPSGTVTIFTAVANADSGAWETTVPAASRTNTITALQRQGDGGTPSRLSAPPVVVTASPRLAPPTFTVPEHAPTGALTITGTAHPGATVSGRFDGDPQSTTADASTGAWSINVSVRAGTQTAVFRQEAEVDGTAEASDDGAEQSVTGVGAPSVSGPDEDAAVGASFSVSGTALPSATVVVAHDGATLATVTADGSGAFSAPVSLPAIGRYALAVTQTRGGVSGAATVRNVRRPPVAPIFDAPVGFVTGPVRLRGSGLPSAQIAVYDDDSGATPVATTTADGSGAFDLSVSRPSGNYRYTVTQAIDGNESARSVARDVTVWGTALTVEAPNPVVGLGNPATLGGNAMPGATVTVTAAGAPPATVIANGIGRWSASPSWPAGRHAVTAVQRVAGDDGQPVEGPTVTVLPAPTIDPLAVPAAATVALTGRALDGVTVVVVDQAGRTLGSALSGVDGLWALTTTVPLAPGAHSLSAFARLDGVDGPRSAGLAVVVPEPAVPPGPVDPTPPIPIVDSPIADPPVVTPGPIGGAARFAIAKPTVTKRTTVRVGMTVPGAGRVTVGATIRVKGKRIAYGSASLTTRVAGRPNVVLKPSRQARAALKRLRTAKLAITVRFTPAGGKPTTATTTTTVRGGR